MSKNNCIFCKISNLDALNQIEEKYEYPLCNVVVITPLNPVTKGHKLFIPTIHLDGVADEKINNSGEILANVMFSLDEYCKKYLPNKDFNVIINKGTNATQTIFHLHVHLVPRKENDNLKLPWSEK